MFIPGNVLHGSFNLKAVTKNKYVVILHVDSELCLIFAFTTSRERSGVDHPIHGKNPKDGIPKSYVFKSGVIIGKDSNGNDFSFKADTTIVPDYGVISGTVDDINRISDNLVKVCKLTDGEYTDLIYTLYHCKRTPHEHKRIYENILNERLNKQ